MQRWEVRIHYMRDISKDDLEVMHNKARSTIAQVCSHVVNNQLEYHFDEVIPEDDPAVEAIAGAPVVIESIWLECPYCTGDEDDT